MGFKDYFIQNDNPDAKKVEEVKTPEPYEVAHLLDLEKQRDALQFRLKRVEEMIKKAETHKTEVDNNPGIK